MNIAIDLRCAEIENSGLTRFSKNIFFNLVQEKELLSRNFYIILPPKYMSRHLKDFSELDGKNINVIFWNKNRSWRWKIGLYYFDFKMYSFLKMRDIGLYINPHFDPPILPGIDIVSTIHDIRFLKVKKYFKNFGRFKKFISEVRIIVTILLTKYLVTVSKSTKEELISRYKYLPKKYQDKLNNILIIPNGVTEFKSNKKVEFNKDFPKEFYLYVGDRRPHKNISYLIDLIYSLRKKNKDDSYLLIAGSNSYKNKELQNKILKHKEFIYEVLNPEDYFINYLYKNCKSFFLLSKHEGFGIPVIEAGAQGSKLVLNDIPPLKEIAPENALFINCNSIVEDTKKVQEYVESNILINPKEVLNSWRWDLSSKKLCNFILKIY